MTISISLRQSLWPELCTPHNDSLIWASQSLPALSQLMEQHHGLSQAAISPGDWVHLEVNSAACQSCYTTTRWEKLYVSFWTLALLIWQVHTPSDNHTVVFFGAGWFTIPLGLSFIVSITNSHFTHPWLFWVHDSLPLTPKIWSLQKDSSTQAHERPPNP